MNRRGTTLCFRLPRLRLLGSQEARHQPAPVEAVEAGHQEVPEVPALTNPGAAGLEDGADLPSVTGAGMMMRVRTSTRG